MAQHEPRDPNYEQKVRDSFARQAAMGTFGARLLRVAPGEVDMELPFRAELTQQNGFLHAGVVTAVMDSAAGYAAFSLMAPGSDVLSVEFKVNLLAPAVGERFEARGRVLRSGRTLTVCTADLVAFRGEQTSHVATMVATMIAR